MKNLLQKIIRFIIIDLQYFSTNLSLKRKTLDVLRTNSRLFSNLLLKPKSLQPVIIGDRLVYYDTLFATKTLLTTIYDFYIETKMATLLPSKPVVIDVGANIGQFVVAVKSFYPNAQIYSVEPDRDVYQILNKNIKQFKKVTSFNYGLSNKEGRVDFYKSNSFSEWSGLHPLEGHNYEKISVQIKRGDRLFSSITHIDLLKIDVEGAELEVLQGMKKTISKCKYILIEASIMRNPSDLGSKNVLTFLFENNYTIDHIGRIFSDDKGQYQGAVDILLKNRLYE